MIKVDDIFKFCINDDVIQLENHLKFIVNINERSQSKGWTLLTVASYNHSINCVKLLLQYGADINSTNKKGTTVLMFAKSKVFINRDFSFLDFLISKGANLYQSDFFGKNILDYVCESNDNEMIEYFMSKMSV